MAEHPAIAWIRRYFAGELEPHEWDQLVQHLRGCPSCGNAYEEAVRRELPAGADPQDLSPQAVERAHSLALKRRAGSSSSLLAPSAVASAGQAGNRSTAWVAIGAALAAAAAVALWFSIPPTAVEPRVSSKGGGGVSADLYCSTEGASPQLLVNGEPCAVGSLVVVKAVSSSSSLVHVSVISCQGNFDCQLNSSGPLTGTATLKGPLLSAGQRLRVFVVWSDAPVSELGLRRSTQSARGSGRALFDTLVLPELPFSQLAYTVNAQTK